MATHDYVIANGTGAAVRSDLNGALAAIVSQNSNASAPATTYAYMSWADTSAGVMKMRNGANSAWISLYELDGTFLASDISLAAGSAAAPSLFFTGDTNTGLFSPGADTVALATAGQNRLHISSGGLVGIGITGPSSLLELGGATNGSTLTFSCTSANPATERLLASLNYKTAGYGPVQMMQAYSVASLADNASTLRFYTDSGTSTQQERLRIDQAGRVGIGTTSPSSLLHLAAASGTIQMQFNNGGTSSYIGHDSAFTGLDIAAGGGIKFRYYNGTSFAEAARIDTSGRLLVGTSSARSLFFAGGVSAQTQIEGNSTATASLSITRNDATADGNALILAKARSSAYAILQYVNGTTSDDRIGRISFQGADGTNMVPAASIEAWVDATPGANDMPGRLVFSTTADGASSPTERMRITNGGDIHTAGRTSSTLSTVGCTLEVSGAIWGVRSGGTVGVFNRRANDGTLIEFYQDDTVEGNISVSGTTVSYNGAHLSRWSQLPGGATREEILRGTVLSNIDEMCGWGEEANEQLNRMKVSDVEGDKNVSGVFQCWDDDDDTYTDDFYCAMTGDFIIRIAEGVTVERGDLLMSAGDGTAKPQDDDSIRSKTVAKVTSTHVTCTYEDGSYCVPCVLMAC